FVRFMEEADAQKCLEKIDSEDGLILDGRKIMATIAMPKDKLKKELEKRREKKPKDKRNLYLAREGLVRAGTLAATGVSQQDLDKRLKLELNKRKALRNLHNFISTTRLC